jgi:hypothetical protein
MISQHLVTHIYIYKYIHIYTDDIICIYDIYVIYCKIASWCSEMILRYFQVLPFNMLNNSTQKRNYSMLKHILPWNSFFNSVILPQTYDFTVWLLNIPRMEEILHHQKDGRNFMNSVVGFFPLINWWFGFRIHTSYGSYAPFSWMAYQ